MGSWGTHLIDDFNIHPDKSGRHAAQKDILAISQMLMDGVSLPPLVSSPLVDDILEGLGDRGNDLGAWFTGVDVEIASTKTRVGT